MDVSLSFILTLLYFTFHSLFPLLEVFLETQTYSLIQANCKTSNIPNSFVSVGNHRHMVYVYNNGVYGWSAYMVHFIWTLCV